MEWLFEVTVNEMVKVGKEAETIPELRDTVREYVQKRIKDKQKKERRCRDCKSPHIAELGGVDTCIECGACNMVSLSYYVSYNFSKNDYLKKKSRHDRVRWFNRLLVKHVSNCDRQRLSNQFKVVVRCIERMRLDRGRNIVRYKFYLLRLASRSKIKLHDPPEDIKTQRLVNILKDRLYGKVFVELGWKGKECPYYTAWVSRNIPQEKN
jgi:hypothetical protein